LRETAGAARTRASLRPLFSGGTSKVQPSGAARREIAKPYSPSLQFAVIAAEAGQYDKVRTPHFAVQHSL